MPHDRLLGFAAFLALACSAVAQNVPAPARSPLNFEPNQGQTSLPVSYIVQSPSHQILIDAGSLTYAFAVMGETPRVEKPQFIALRWEGPAGSPHFNPANLLPGKSHYFLGSDPSHGITNIPHYSELDETDALRGVDIRYRSDARGELEYDLVIAGQTDVSLVGFTVEGADQVRVEKDGALSVIIDGKQRLVQPPPHAYEIRGGQKFALTATYLLKNNNRVGFDVRGRTPGSDLVIDPVVVYGSLLGVHDPMYRWADEGGPNTHGLSTAVDPAGNFFVAGQTYAFDFPITPGALESECPWVGVACVWTPLDFVTKFSSSGQLLYSTYLGGSYGFNPYHQPRSKMLAVDNNGFAYIAGESGGGSVFPTTAGAFQTSCASSNGCATLTKLNQSGSALVYSTYFGGVLDGGSQFTGTSDTYANALALGPNGDVFLAGGTHNSTLPTTSGAYQYNCPSSDGGCNSGFVARFNLNTNGSSARIFATYIGATSGKSEVESIAIDRYGDVYVLGLSTADMPSIASFGTGMFPLGLSASDSCYALGAPCETFVAKLNGNYGQALRGSTILRGVAGKSIVVDGSLNAFVGGATTSGLATTPGTLQPKFKGGASDGFVTKLDPSGYFELYSTFLGGAGDDVVSDIAVNGWGMAFVTGTTSSTDFPLAPGAFGKKPAGGFVSALNADGRSLYYSSFLGGAGGAGIALDKAWNAVVTGIADSTTPLTSNAVQTQLAGFDDAFIIKISIAADLRMSVTPSTSTISRNSVVIYHAQVLNAGPDGSDNVVFTNNIPAGMAYAGVYVPNGNGCTEPRLGATTGTLTCNKTRLESGQTYYVNVYLRAIGAVGMNVTNQMKTSARTQDLWPANNAVSSTVAIK